MKSSTTPKIAKGYLDYKKIKEETKLLHWRRIQTTRIRRQMDRRKEMKKERDVEEREENGAQINDN
jgi:hypothetical protein